jgi:hypothetical protein
MAYDIFSLPLTQISNPYSAALLRRMAKEAINIVGFIVNVYPLLNPNVDKLYGDRYEKGSVYGPAEQIKVAVDWPPQKDLVKYVALYMEKELPLMLYVAAHVNYEPGSRIQFQYNIVDDQNFTNQFKILNRQSVGSPYLIMTALSVAPQRF